MRRYQIFFIITPPLTPDNAVLCIYIWYNSRISERIHMFLRLIFISLSLGKSDLSQTKYIVPKDWMNDQKRTIMPIKSILKEKKLHKFLSDVHNRLGTK